MLVRCTLILSLIIGNQASALTIGPIGNTYPIIENDLLETIDNALMRKAREGRIKKLQVQMNARTKAYLTNPRNGPDLPRAVSTRSWHHKNEFTVKNDIVLPNGEVLHRQGEVFRLPEHVIKNVHYLFVDFNDMKQRQFAKQYFDSLGQHHTDIIITRGSVKNATDIFGQRIYYDQYGKLTSVFSITALPALVKSHGDKLNIIEVGMGKDA